MKKIYNKNAREKALLEEAYGAVYERRNPDADEWGGGLKGVFPGAEEGPEFGSEDAEDDFFAWHDRKKKFLGKRGDVVKDSVTGDTGVIVNVRDYKVDLRNGEREWTAKIRDLVSDEEEEREDNEDIDLTVDAGMSPQDRREAGEY